MQLPTVNQLAEEFSKRLRSGLSETEMANVIRLNMEENNDPGVCHSHDFLDANMVMLSALEHFGFGIADTHSPEVEALWNEAWQTAKVKEFRETITQLAS